MYIVWYFAKLLGVGLFLLGLIVLGNVALGQTLFDPANDIFIGLIFLGGGGVVLLIITLTRMEERYEYQQIKKRQPRR